MKIILYTKTARDGNLEIRINMKDMNSVEITKRLVKGSQNIDRMKNEVEQVVQMIIGFTIRCDSARHKDEISETFESEQCQWTVNGSVNIFDHSKSTITVECWVRGRFGAKAYSSQRNSYPFHTEAAQCVFEGLPVFVEGMLRVFPELREKIEPFMNAADMFV